MRVKGPFNLEAALAGKPIVTFNNLSVEGFELNCDEPDAGYRATVLEFNGAEFIIGYDEQGRCIYKPHQCGIVDEMLRLHMDLSGNVKNAIGRIGGARVSLDDVFGIDPPVDVTVTGRVRTRETINMNGDIVGVQHFDPEVSIAASVIRECLLIGGSHDGNTARIDTTFDRVVMPQRMRVPTLDELLSTDPLASPRTLQTETYFRHTLRLGEGNERLHFYSIQGMSFGAAMTRLLKCYHQARTNNRT